CNNAQIRSHYHVIREAQETFIAVLPFFHSYGMAIAMVLPLSIGATLIMFPKFVAKDILKAVKDYRATVLPGIPSIYSVINTNKEIKTKYDISSINFCISGAAPLPVTTLEEFEHKTGGKIFEGYGLSESSPVTHCNCVSGQRKTGSIGVPVPDTDCKIIDLETGEPVVPGEPGELCIKGPQIMQGYWQREDETRITLKDGWLHTGDVARMDEDGFFYIVERKKDMIICEGFNIYPRELEEFFLEHPKVADAAVIGQPDKLRGEKVIAYVKLKENTEATPDELMSFCRDNLVNYKVPKKILFTDEIPTNIAGKKLRRVLREKQESPES
ncbi:MAG: long-chain fatty acid--CoA ligase, partial [Deltaproteobacteria bacterium]|nr:long-chain fatty acid--CoA ligase [Deltaproteobacteria bacterium]